MIGLKAIHQGSFVHKNTIFQHKARLSSKKVSTLCLCNSSGNSDPEGSSNPDGDTRKQELLARIVQIQTQKVRLIDFLDEKSTYLEQFAEEADAEFGKIGEDALKELDEASERIMESIKGKMQEFEERREKNRLEMEENENELADLEDQMIKDRNEGLFFQNLRPKTPLTDKEKAAAKEETEIIKEVTKDSAGSKIRRNIYLGLIGLLVISIGDSLLSSSADWRKVVLLGAILVGLITQVVYEQTLSLSESKETKQGESKKKGK